MPDGVGILRDRREVGPHVRRADRVTRGDHRVLAIEVPGGARGVRVNVDRRDRPVAQINLADGLTRAPCARPAAFRYRHVVGRRTVARPVEIRIVDGAVTHQAVLARVVAVAVSVGHDEVDRRRLRGAGVGVPEQVANDGLQVGLAQDVLRVLRGIDQQRQRRALEQVHGRSL